MSLTYNPPHLACFLSTVFFSLATSEEEPGEKGPGTRALGRPACLFSNL